VTVRVALVGSGGWGRNILRVLVESARASVVAVADTQAQRRAVAASLAPAALIVATLDEALATSPDAVVIATPPHTHAALALRALAAGADIFVEKPLATRVADAERIVARAASLGRVGVVGHLLRYHPAVERVLELARAGALGAIQGFESTRVSISGDRSASALWTLGPHDFSVLQALDPSPIRAVAARAAPSGDPVHVEVELASGLVAAITLSRVGSAKERRLRVIGAAATATLDDVRAADRVLVVPTEEIVVPWREPLAVEIDHFLRCVEDRGHPLTPLEDGLAVVRAIAAAEDSLHAPSAAWAEPGP
jgi:predicted dehydrogenase